MYKLHHPILFQTILVAGSLISFSATSCYLKEVSLSEVIESNIIEAYRISRDEWDSFGISSIRHFQIATRKASPWDALAKGIILGKESDASFFEKCSAESSTRLLSQCAQQHAIFARDSSDLLSALLPLELGYLASQPNLRTRQYIQHIAPIIDFLRDKLQKGALYLVSQKNLMNVRASQIIIVSIDLNDVFIVEHDDGA